MKLTRIILPAALLGYFSLAYISRMTRSFMLNELAQEYKKQYGNLEIPAKYKTADGIWLGRWIYNQKRLLQGEPEKKGGGPRP